MSAITTYNHVYFGDILHFNRKYIDNIKVIIETMVRTLKSIKAANPNVTTTDEYMEWLDIENWEMINISRRYINQYLDEGNKMNKDDAFLTNSFINLFIEKVRNFRAYLTYFCAANYNELGKDNINRYRSYLMYESYRLEKLLCNMMCREFNSEETLQRLKDICDKENYFVNDVRSTLFYDNLYRR